MDPFLVVLGIVLAAAGIATIVALILHHERKRREAFQHEASRLGLSYERDSSESLPRTHGQYGAFNNGFDRRALNVLRGNYKGVDVRLFEFQYKTQTSNGKTTQTQVHHVGVALANLGRRMPKTTIVPETLGHKLWDAVGGDDIDFESDEFSRRFWVKSDDRRAAYGLIHPRMMEYLMEPGWTRWEVQTPGVCAWQAGRLRPQDAQPILDRLLGFVELVPAVEASRAAPRVGVPA